MSYGYFFSYNVFGGITWVFLFTLMGFFFGNLPFVQKNFELVIVAILLISVVPIVYEFIKARRESKAEKARSQKANIDKTKEIETP
jgi:membrane-associated protein